MPELIIPGAETPLSPDEVEKRFAEAMAAPEPDEPTAPAPQRKQAAEEPPPAPEDKPAHNKARKTSAAPAGGRGKGRGRGRRTPETAAAPAAVPEGTYLRPVAELLQGATIAGALVPIPAAGLRTRIRLQAQLVHEHAQGLAAAADMAARHNTTIRRAVEALTQGSAGWVLPAVMAVAPFAAQSARLWRVPVTEDMAQAADAFELAVRSSIVENQAGAAGESPTA